MLEDTLLTAASTVVAAFVEEEEEGKRKEARGARQQLWSWESLKEVL